MHPDYTRKHTQIGLKDLFYLMLSDLENRNHRRQRKLTSGCFTFLAGCLRSLIPDIYLILIVQTLRGIQDQFHYFHAHVMI